MTEGEIDAHVRWFAKRLFALDRSIETLRQLVRTLTRPFCDSVDSAERYDEAISILTNANANNPIKFGDPDNSMLKGIAYARKYRFAPDPQTFELAVGQLRKSFPLNGQGLRSDNALEYACLPQIVTVAWKAGISISPDVLLDAFRSLEVLHDSCRLVIGPCRSVCENEHRTQLANMAWIAGGEAGLAQCIVTIATGKTRGKRDQLRALAYLRAIMDSHLHAKEVRKEYVAFVEGLTDVISKCFRFCLEIQREAPFADLFFALDCVTGDLSKAARYFAPLVMPEASNAAAARVAVQVCGDSPVTPLASVPPHNNATNKSVFVICDVNGQKRPIPIEVAMRADEDNTRSPVHMFEATFHNDAACVKNHSVGLSVNFLCWNSDKVVWQQHANCTFKVGLRAHRTRRRLPCQRRRR